VSLLDAEDAVNAQLRPDQAAEVLRSTRIFSALDRASLLSVAMISRQRSYDRGQYLWYQGDPGDRLVVICSGMVKVVFTSRQGDEILLVTLDRYESLGELAILDDSPRSASVIAVEPTTVLMLPRSAVRKLMATHPSVLDAVLRSLGGLVLRRRAS